MTRRAFLGGLAGLLGAIWAGPGSRLGPAEAAEPPECCEAP